MATRPLTHAARLALPPPRPPGGGRRWSRRCAWPRPSGGPCRRPDARPAWRRDRRRRDRCRARATASGVSSSRTSADRPRRPATARSGMAVVAGAGRTSRLPAGSPSAALRPATRGRRRASSRRRRPTEAVGRGLARHAGHRGRRRRPAATAIRCAGGRRRDGRPGANGVELEDRRGGAPGDGTARNGAAVVSGPAGAAARGGGTARGGGNGREREARESCRASSRGRTPPAGAAGGRPGRRTAGRVDAGGEQAVAAPVGAVASRPASDGRSTPPRLRARARRGRRFGDGPRSPGRAPGRFRHCLIPRACPR